MTIEIPLTLPLTDCWEIATDRFDSVRFFPALADLFPDATEMYVEATSLDDELRDIFTRHAGPGRYLPKPQTIWSSGKIERFRCAFDTSLLAELSAAASHHAEPELLDHLFVYREDVVLMEWPDAWDGPIWIALEIPEERVQHFAALLGGRVARNTPW